MSNHTPPVAVRKNVLSWFEIPVSDLARSQRLYESMLDTKLEVTSFMGIPHAVISNSDHSCVSGALFQDAKRVPRKGEGTVIYLLAPDGVACCLSRAVEAGAKVVLPITSIGPQGNIATVEDFDGNVVGLHEGVAQ